MKKLLAWLRRQKQQSNPRVRTTVFWNGETTVIGEIGFRAQHRIKIGRHHWAGTYY